MIAVMQLVTKHDKSFSHFDFVAENKDLKSIIEDKHMKKYFLTISKNDLMLNRQTVFAVNYHDQQKLAQFCLIPLAA
jgi:poly(3-hydroxyalkanoate) synthetase